MHKLTSKLLDGIRSSSKDEPEIIPVGLFLEWNKEECYMDATSGVTFGREENECPEVVVWVPISTYQLANIVEFT